MPLKIEMNSHDTIFKRDNFIEDKKVSPRWMINHSLDDDVWIVAKTGFDKDHNKSVKLYFKKLLSKNELLTQNENFEILNDIKLSLIYLIDHENINRPSRLNDILIATIHLIKNANEEREKKNKPLIRNLSMISFEDITDYLRGFQIDKEKFNSAYELIRKQNFHEIKWKEVTKIFFYKTRYQLTLENKLKSLLRREQKLKNKASHYNSEYENANISDFDIDEDLSPNEKTISNEISKISCLWRSRPVQKYQFQHNIYELISDGKMIFLQTTPSKKTRTIPLNVAIHNISHSIEFIRKYAEGLRTLLNNYKRQEKKTIKELEIYPSESVKNTTLIKETTFKNIAIPESLKELNITSWGHEGVFENLTPKHHREELSFGSCILLYTASIWILISSFTALRSLSLETLKRNCFQISPIDGLFDIVAKLPKRSELFELEEVYRPIPDLIFDYGIDFSCFVSDLEERHNLYFDENKAFLFGKVLALSHYDSFWQSSNFNKSKSTYLSPLSYESLYKALCFFQDWSESPLIEGKRWYLSKHQPRKLFAVLYFNFSNDTGLEELSWFMGHSSIEQTFHYAEIHPSSEWIEEAELTISKIGASLNMKINSDNTIKKIINQARSQSTVELVIESLVTKMIENHKKTTGEEVRFYRIENKEIFFYFSNDKEKQNVEI
ncbi:hypothetical protein [Devosia sp.]|uniref:hypothetical protein n=1 Tax=Devosia sp. TaxID=1871048 RepID=UPI003A8D9DF0